MTSETLCFVLLAALLAGGIWIWRFQRKWDRLEALLRRVCGEAGAPPPWPEEEEFGEVGRLLSKFAERHQGAVREGSDARFNLRAILASMEDGVLVADHQCRVTFVNPALLQMFAIKGEPVGESVLGVLRLPILQTMLEGILDEGAAQQAEIEPAISGRDAAPQIIVSAAPLREASGRPGAVIVFRDISRLRRLEEIRREFVANVSHELRTPLSIFHGYLENLIDSPEPVSEEVRSSLLTMRKHAMRLNALVEDLLTLARLESNRDLLVPEPVDFAAFLSETQKDWRPRAAAKNIQLGVDVEPDLPEVMVDLLKFQQVLGNLLDNALKYTPAGGRVMLRAAEVQEDGTSWLELRVEDTGTGIPRDDLPRVFQRFYRADKARSREMGGTGLGLAIVKHIVQAHHGSVRAESELGKGARIILRVPLIPPAE